MSWSNIATRRDNGRVVRQLLSALAVAVVLLGSVRGAEREVIDSITTSRIVYGEPYQLAGKRLVFTNWYYIQPGDVDWRDAEGRHIDLQGDKGVLEADHVGINAPRGIRIMAQRPEVVGNLSRPGRMILRDGDIYKGWTSTDYYESADAFQWEHRGALVLDEPVEDGIHHVFIDPVGSSDERFKAVWVGHITRAEFEAFRAKHPKGWEPRSIFLLGEKDEVTCLRPSVSPDGIHWRTLPDPIVVEYCDTLNTAYYDLMRREYVVYTRYWSVGPRAESLGPDIRNSWTGVGRRAMGRTSSANFGEFEPSEMILEPTPDMLPSEQLYTNCRTTIPGAPDQHLMFPTIWNASVNDTTRIALASSSDGIRWHWVPGGDLLQTQAFGEWDGGCIWANPDLVELPNGDWALPYIGHNLPHKYPRGQRAGGEGYAVWPRGRLVGVEAKEEGEFTLIPILAPGKTLHINAETLRTGFVKVEVLGMDGRSLADCNPIIGDHANTPVTWKDAGDLGVEAGRSITLRISLKQATVYGLTFE